MSRLCQALVVGSLLLAVGPPATAGAEPLAVSIASPSAGSSSNEAALSFIGSTSDVADVVTVRIYEGNGAVGIPAQTLESATPSGGVWTARAATLPDGTYTAVAQQLDLETLETASSKEVTFTVDTAPPVVSLNPIAPLTNNATPAFSGGGGEAPGDGATVTVVIHEGSTVGGAVAAEASAPVVSGAWSLTASHLPDGTYTVQAVQRDQAGNEGRSGTATFRIDTTPPILTITSPTAHETLKSSSRPTFSGTANDDSGEPTAVTIEIFHEESTAAADLVQTLSVERSGSAWTTGGTGPRLPNGIYTVRVKELDSAGNLGESPAVAFTVEAPPPTVTLNPLPHWTNDSSPSFAGTADTFEARPEVTVNIWHGTSASGALAETLGANESGGAWAVAATDALPDGTYTAVAEQSDEAGNPPGKSQPRTFTIDTVRPAVSLTSLPTVVGSSKPSFGGAAGTAADDIASVKLTIYEGTAASGTPVETVKVTPSGGSWAAVPSKSLADGTYTAIAEQSDEAGNQGFSGPTTFTVKTKGPAVSLDPVPKWTNDSTPTFGGGVGTAAHDEPEVTLEIYPGTKEKGSKPVRAVNALDSGAQWTAGPAQGLEALPDGTYTAVAVQFDEAHNEALSIAETFTVDTVAPVVTLSAPATSMGVETVSGSAGTAPGDRRQVTAELFAGANVEPGNAAEAITVNSTGGVWSATFAGLAPGEYTVVARQFDEAGNVGSSPASAFTVTAPPTPAAVLQTPASSPVASFTWAPTNPTVGQSVSLASSSTDASSTIGSYAWDLAGSGQFGAGTAAMTTSFAAAGPHIVQLRVTDGNGRSSTVAQTIDVTPALPQLMQPFPIVRIAGAETSSGVKIRLLTVQAPAGATVQVTCSGKGCKPRSESRVAVASSGAKVLTGASMLTFKRFERSLRAGVTLQIRVTKAGEIGKYTSFAVRRNKLPVRTDACLQPTSSKPSACPSS